MFKLFKGFHMVETYHKEKKEKRLSKNNQSSRIVRLLIPIIASLCLWMMPVDAWGIEGLTVVQHRVMTIFVLATLMWVLEAVPAWTTSVAVVTLLLLTVSDSSLWLFTDVEGLGKTKIGRAHV